MNLLALFVLLISTQPMALAKMDFVQGQPPPPGALVGKADVLAHADDATLAIFADAGRPFLQAGHYVEFQCRAWYDPDSGVVGLPDLPDGLYPLRARKAAATCTDPTLCDGGAGLLQVAEVQFDCACSTGAQCRVPNPDGGTFPDSGPTPVPAPLGVTLSPPFQGTGCFSKACIRLWSSPDDDSWPAECPLQ